MISYYQKLSSPIVAWMFKGDGTFIRKKMSFRLIRRKLTCFSWNKQPITLQKKWIYLHTEFKCLWILVEHKRFFYFINNAMSLLHRLPGCRLFKCSTWLTLQGGNKRTRETHVNKLWTVKPSLTELHQQLPPYFCHKHEIF